MLISEEGKLKILKLLLNLDWNENDENSYNDSTLIEKNENDNEKRKIEKNEIIELNEDENDLKNLKPYNKEEDNITLDDDSLTISIENDNNLIEENNNHTFGSDSKDKNNGKNGEDKEIKYVYIDNSNLPTNINGNENNNIFLDKKRKDDNSIENKNDKELKYYFNCENENRNYFKYIVKEVENKIAILACDDEKCCARGIYNIDSKKFNLLSYHSMVYEDHSYASNMNKNDKM
jgi:hypothetical protein